jgi:hypothetical protein
LSLKKVISLADLTLIKRKKRLQKKNILSFFLLHDYHSVKYEIHNGTPLVSFECERKLLQQQIVSQMLLYSHWVMKKWLTNNICCLIEINYLLDHLDRFQVMSDSLVKIQWKVVSLWVAPHLKTNQQKRYFSIIR